MRKWLTILLVAASANALAQTNPASPKDGAERVLTPEQVAQGHFDLGLRFMREKKLAGAVEAFGKAIEAKPDFAEAHSNLGIAYVQLGKQTKDSQRQLQFYQTAATQFGIAAELKPKDRLVCLMWSETLVLIGDLPVENRLRLACYQGAAEKCRKAVELAPQEWEGYNKWGAILSVKLPDFTVDAKSRLQLHKEAAGLFAKAAERARFSGELGPVYANWGNALMHAARAASDTDEKRELLTQAADKFEQSSRAIANAPNTYAMWGSALVELSKVSRSRNDLRDGIDKLNTSLSLNPTEPGTLYNLACAYALMDNPVMAVDSLKRCFDADPNKTYRNSAPQDQDLATLRGNPGFDELFSEQRPRGIPNYNPRLGDAPR